MLNHKALVQWPGREEISIEIETDHAGIILSGQLKGVGGPELLSLITEYRQKYFTTASNLNLKELPLPKGRTPAVLCLREALLKVKGEWLYPYQDEELCHCRAVLTSTVDQAICAGAHTPRKVSEATSASTACGTCRPDVEAIIKYRLGH